MIPAFHTASDKSLGRPGYEARAVCGCNLYTYLVFMAVVACVQNYVLYSSSTITKVLSMSTKLHMYGQNDICLL